MKTEQNSEACATDPPSQQDEKIANCESFDSTGDSIDEIEIAQSYLRCMNAIFSDAFLTLPYQTLGRFIGASWAAKPENETAAVRIVTWDDLLPGHSRPIFYSNVPMVRLAIAKAVARNNAFNLDEFWNQIPVVDCNEFYLGFVEGVAEWVAPWICPKSNNRT